MTDETVTQDIKRTRKEQSKKLHSQHEQFCLGVLTLAQNGAYEEDLLPLLERVYEQALDLR